MPPGRQEEHREEHCHAEEEEGEEAEKAELLRL